jgi:hypothetical protein
MDTTANTFTNRSNARRAAEAMITNGTAPAVDYGIKPRDDGRFEIVWKIGNPAVSEPDVASAEQNWSGPGLTTGEVETEIAEVPEKPMPPEEPKPARQSRRGKAPAARQGSRSRYAIDPDLIAAGRLPDKAPEVTSATNRRYQVHFDKLFELAAAGDWGAVRDYQVTGSNSYSRMVRALPPGSAGRARRGLMANVHKRTWMTKTLGERVTWTADYFAPGPDGKRKRHTKSFKTKKEATAWLANTVVEIRLGTHTPAHKSPTVLEAGEAWIAQAETDGLERSTIVAYRQLLDLHVRPFLGHLKLAELTPGAVQSFRNVLVRNGRSRTMADRVVSGSGQFSPRRCRPAGWRATWCARSRSTTVAGPGSRSATRRGCRSASTFQRRPKSRL